MAKKKKKKKQSYKKKQGFLSKHGALIGILILVAVIAYGGYNGWFGNITNIFSTYNYANQDTQDQLDYTASGTCTLSIVPQVIVSGQNVTGTIQDGANTLCTVYATDGSGWRIIYTGTTDATGRLSQTTPITLVGTFAFRAICGTCITNQANLVVQPPPVPPADSDGDGFSDEEEEAADTNPFDPTDYPGSSSTNTCEYTIVPDGVGDAGGFCAALSCDNSTECCDNYWNPVLQKIKCACTIADFFCQTNFEYVMSTPCECPPFSTYTIVGTNFKCVLFGG